VHPHDGWVQADRDDDREREQEQDLSGGNAETNA
jgi:hypothetical protein